MLKYKTLIKLYALSCLLICCVYGDTILVSCLLVVLLICYVYGDTIQTEVAVLCLLIALVLPHNAEIFISIKTSRLVPKFDGTILCKTKNMISGYKYILWTESVPNTGVVAP
jgi:hypothetical protein